MSISIPRTWKTCRNPDILRVFNEVCTEARNLGYVFKEPVLYIIKSTSSWGRCKFNCETNESAIALNEVFLKNPEACRNTMVHEIAHSIAIGDHHGDKWRAAGNNIGKKWNIDVQRTNNYESLGVESIRKQADLNKYVLKCRKCGHEYYHARMCDSVRNPSAYRCGCCKGDIYRVK